MLPSTWPSAPPPQQTTPPRRPTSFWLSIILALGLMVITVVFFLLSRPHLSGSATGNEGSGGTPATATATPKPAASVAGTWQFSLMDTTQGGGITGTLNLIENGTNVQGTLTLDQSIYQERLGVTGTFDGSQLVIAGNLTTVNDQIARYTFTGTLSQDGHSLAGPYSATGVNYSYSEAGTWNAMR